MTPLLAVLEFTDYVVIAVIAAVVAGISALARGPDVNLQILFPEPVSGFPAGAPVDFRRTR